MKIIFILGSALLLSQPLCAQNEEVKDTLQYSGHLMQKADSLEKILMLGKIEGRRRRERQRMR